MALEILVAKMVAPLYGASLYVWASIIGVTLSALAIGYFAGGRISEKHSRVHTLLLLLFAVSLLCLPNLNGISIISEYLVL